MNTNISLFVKQFSFLAVVFAILALVPFDAALAQQGGGGLSQASDFMKKLEATLKLIAPVTVTIAIIWCGFKMIFQGASFRDVAPILIGGFLIGAASYISSMLIG